MLIGPSGCGKTVLMSNTLQNLLDYGDNDYDVTNVSLNYYTTSGKF